MHVKGSLEDLLFPTIAPKLLPHTVTLPPQCAQDQRQDGFMLILQPQASGM